MTLRNVARSVPLICLLLGGFNAGFFIRTNLSAAITAIVIAACAALLILWDCYISGRTKE